MLSAYMAVVQNINLYLAPHVWRFCFLIILSIYLPYTFTLILNGFQEIHIASYAYHQFFYSQRIKDVNKENKDKNESSS